jgi:hypothetical protein
MEPLDAGRSCKRRFDMNEKAEQDKELDCEVTVNEGAHSTCDMNETPETDSKKTDDPHS